MMFKFFRLLILFVFIAIGFCLPFLAEGGRLHAIFQPLAAFSITALSYGLTVGQIGYESSNKCLRDLITGAVTSSQGNLDRTRESLFQNIFVATLLTEFGQWIILLHHLSEGGKVFGHLFMATTACFLYGSVLMALVPLNKVERQSRIWGIALTAVLPAVGIVIAFLSVLK